MHYIMNYVCVRIQLLTSLLTLLFRYFCFYFLSTWQGNEKSYTGIFGEGSYRRHGSSGQGTFLDNKPFDALKVQHVSVLLFFKQVIFFRCKGLLIYDSDDKYFSDCQL